MLKSKKIILGLVSLVTTLGITSVNVKASVVSNRMAGQNRVKTSVAVANDGWTKSDYAVIAYAWDFPDAVSASPLAYKFKAPILLTDKESLSTDVDSELSNLQVKHVFIIGGTGVVSPKVEAQITAKGIDVKRLYGANRYETSIAIANEIGTSSSVVVTNGYNPYEALSISSIAAKKGMPIILTAKKEVPNAVQNYLMKNRIIQTYVLGNADGAAEDDGVANNPLFNNPIRITGANLYERNINIIKQFGSDINYSKEYFATGKDFADALAGSALAANTSSPIIFVDDNMPQVTKDFIASKSSAVTSIAILGGTGAVSDSNVEKVKSLLAPTTVATIVLPNGDKYVGDIKNGAFNGQGTLTSVSGNKYVGEFKDNQFNGQGTFTNANGEKYVGEFKDNKPNGQGTCTSANGNKYVGEFKDGAMSGQGVFICANGDKYEGQVKDNKMNGYGTFTYANGDKYVGEFKDGMMNGQGTLTGTNGNKYVGQFKDSKFNGQGTLTYANGTVYQGQWQDGKFIGN